MSTINTKTVRGRIAILSIAAVITTLVFIGLVAVKSAAASDDHPWTDAELAAVGVTSVTHDNGTWTATLDGVPTEFKQLEPSQIIVCGNNYQRPCSTVMVWQSSDPCTFFQIDGLPGHNSSDPYVCRTPPVTPTPTPTPTEEPTPSPTPTITATPSPTPTPEPSTPPSSPTPSPTPTPQPSGSPSPTPTTPSSPPVPTPTVVVPPGTSTPVAVPVAQKASSTPQLAETGTPSIYTTLMVIVAIIVPLGIAVILLFRPRRRH